MSDPIPKDGGTEARDSEESLPDRLPPKDLPEELLRRRLARLDTRRALAELCKAMPGLEEVLLPRGIQADALTRKSGARTPLVRGIARKITQDAAAWGAFRTAVQEQIPPETFEALEGFSPEKLEELSEAHTTEGLLLAALSAEEEPDEEVIRTLIGAWREEHQRAEKRASEDAHVRELEGELERLKQENEQLSFASRAAKERAAALAEEVEVLTGEREGASDLVRRAEESAASALDVRGQLDERIAELERRGVQLERALEGERTAYSRAAERVEGLHEELGRVVAERDRIQDALQNAKFTDKGFGELLVRAVKNEVGALPASIDSTAQTARLLEFMGRVLAAHNDLREPRTEDSAPGSEPSSEDAEDSEPSLASPPYAAADALFSRSGGGRGSGRQQPSAGLWVDEGAGRRRHQARQPGARGAELQEARRARRGGDNARAP